MLNETQVKELVNAMKEYQGQDIIVSSDNIADEDGVLLESVNFVIKDKVICLMDRENRNEFEFSLDEIEDVYLDKLDIYLDSVAEVHIMFGYMGSRFDLLNLV